MSSTAYNTADLERVEAALRALEQEGAGDDWGATAALPQATFTLMPSETLMLNGRRFITQEQVRYDRAALHEFRDTHFAHMARNIELPDHVYMTSGDSLLDSTDKDDVTDRHPIDWCRAGWMTHDQVLPSILDWQNHGNPFVTKGKSNTHGFTDTANKVFEIVCKAKGNPIALESIKAEITSNRRADADAGFYVEDTLDDLVLFGFMRKLFLRTKRGSAYYVYA